jgi:hypothetical protein
MRPRKLRNSLWSPPSSSVLRYRRIVSKATPSMARWAFRQSLALLHIKYCRYSRRAKPRFITASDGL